MMGGWANPLWELPDVPLWSICLDSDVRKSLGAGATAAMPILFAYTLRYVSILRA
jgi:hypothetical protein